MVEASLGDAASLMCESRQRAIGAVLFSDELELVPHAFPRPFWSEHFHRRRIFIIVEQPRLHQPTATREELPHF
jgi:hypothetical protein